MKQLIALGIITLFVLASACNNTNSNSSEQTASNHHDEEIDLVMMMGRLQLFMNKMYFAGINNNLELRDFYVHEIEETMEEIADGDVTHEGVDVSENMKLYGVSQLELFEKALESNEDFEKSYSNFINACNSCHIVSKYPFIKIKVPETPVFDNQVYEVQ